MSGEEIAVFHTRAGGVYATQALCPHRQGPLADGLIGGTTLLCPLHAWKFDLATGEALDGRLRPEDLPDPAGADGEMWLTAAPARSLSPGREVGISRPPSARPRPACGVGKRHLPVLSRRRRDTS